MASFKPCSSKLRKVTFRVSVYGHLESVKANDALNQIIGHEQAMPPHQRMGLTSVLPFFGPQWKQWKDCRSRRSSPSVIIPLQLTALSLAFNIREIKFPSTMNLRRSR